MTGPGPVAPTHLGPAWAQSRSFSGIHLVPVGSGPIEPIHLGPGPLGSFGPTWIHHLITRALLTILILWSHSQIRRYEFAQGTMTRAPKGLARGGLFSRIAFFSEDVCGITCSDMLFLISRNCVQTVRRCYTPLEGDVGRFPI